MSEKIKEKNDFEGGDDMEGGMENDNEETPSEKERRRCHLGWILGISIFLVLVLVILVIIKCYYSEPKDNNHPCDDDCNSNNARDTPR